MQTNWHSKCESHAYTHITQKSLTMFWVWDWRIIHNLLYKAWLISPDPQEDRSKSEVVYFSFQLNTLVSMRLEGFYPSLIELLLWDDLKNPPQFIWYHHLRPNSSQLNPSSLLGSNKRQRGPNPVSKGSAQPVQNSTNRTSVIPHSSTETCSMLSCRNS